MRVRGRERRLVVVVGGRRRRRLEAREHADGAGRAGGGADGVHGGCGWGGRRRGGRWWVRGGAKGDGGKTLSRVRAMFRRVVGGAAGVARELTNRDCRGVIGWRRRCGQSLAGTGGDKDK